MLVTNYSLSVSLHLRTEVMNASEQIDNEIEKLADWRGALISRTRAIIKEVAPDVTEEWKWNTPVWSKNGMLCAAGAFKDHVKINFFKGASLTDSNHLFNAGLEAKATRAIDFKKEDLLNEPALRDLISEAVAFNSR